MTESTENSNMLMSLDGEQMYHTYILFTCNLACSVQEFWPKGGGGGNRLQLAILIDLVRLVCGEQTGAHCGSISVEVNVYVTSVSVVIVTYYIAVNPLWVIQTKTVVCSLLLACEVESSTLDNSWIIKFCG